MRVGTSCFLVRIHSGVCAIFRALWRKVIAMGVCVCFVLMSIDVYAIAGIIGPETKVGAQRAVPLLPYKIPSELGTIETSVNGLPHKTILYIQDAHDSLEAQENIAEIITHFVQKYDVKTVYEEGYSGEVPTDEYFSLVKDADRKREVSHYLMDHLRIGGAEFAHINREKDFRLVGADNIDRQIEGISWYQATAQVKSEVAVDLNTMQEEIKKLTDRFFPKPLKQWMKLRKRLDENKIDLLEYIKRAIKLEDDREVLLVGAGGNGAKGSPVSRPYVVIPILLAASESAADETVLEEAQAILPQVLFQEIHRLENDIADFYLPGDKGKKIFSYYKGLNLLKRLNDLKVSPAEWEASKHLLEQLKTEQMASLIAQERKKSIVLSKWWEKTMDRAIRFYEVVESRDLAIARSLDEFVSAPDEPIAVLVYGGFHKNTIEGILRDKQLSYKIISPKITDADEEHRKRYRELMSGGYQPFRLPSETSGSTGIALANEAQVAIPANLSRAMRYPPIFVDGQVSDPEKVKRNIELLSDRLSSVRYSDAPAVILRTVEGRTKDLGTRRSFAEPHQARRSAQDDERMSITSSTSVRAEARAKSDDVEMPSRKKWQQMIRAQRHRFAENIMRALSDGKRGMDDQARKQEMVFDIAEPIEYEFSRLFRVPGYEGGFVVERIESLIVIVLPRWDLETTRRAVRDLKGRLKAKVGTYENFSGNVIFTQRSKFATGQGLHLSTAKAIMGLLTFQGSLTRTVFNFSAGDDVLASILLRLPNVERVILWDQEEEDLEVARTFLEEDGWQEGFQKGGHFLIVPREINADSLAEFIKTQNLSEEELAVVMNRGAENEEATQSVIDWTSEDKFVRTVIAAGFNKGKPGHSPFFSKAQADLESSGFRLYQTTQDTTRDDGESILIAARAESRSFLGRAEGRAKSDGVEIPSRKKMSWLSDEDAEDLAKDVLHQLRGDKIKKPYDSLFEMDFETGSYQYHHWKSFKIEGYDGRLVVERVGPLVFVVILDQQQSTPGIKQQTIDLLREKLNQAEGLYDRNRGNIMIAAQPAYSSDFGFHLSAVEAIFGMLAYRERLKDHLVLDLGAADGLLARIALRMEGVSRVVLWDNKEERLDKARIFLGDDGWNEGFRSGGEYEIVHKELSKKALNEFLRVHELKNVNLAVLKNLGPEYPEVNLKMIEWVRRRENVRLLISSGYDESIAGHKDWYQWAKDYLSSSQFRGSSFEIAEPIGNEFEMFVALRPLSNAQSPRLETRRLKHEIVNQANTLFSLLAKRSPDIPKEPDILIVAGNEDFLKNAPPAARFFAKNPSKYVVFTGKGKGAEPEAVLFHREFVRTLDEMNASYDSNRFLIEPESMDTQQNAELSLVRLLAKLKEERSELSKEPISVVLSQRSLVMWLSEKIFEKRFVWPGGVTFYSYAPVVPELTTGSKWEQAIYWLQDALGRVARIEPFIKKGYIDVRLDDPEVIEMKRLADALRPALYNLILKRDFPDLKYGWGTLNRRIQNGTATFMLVRYAEDRDTLNQSVQTEFENQEFGVYQSASSFAFRRFNEEQVEIYQPGSDFIDFVGDSKGEFFLLVLLTHRSKKSVGRALSIRDQVAKSFFEAPQEIYHVPASAQSALGEIQLIFIHRLPEPFDPLRVKQRTLQNLGERPDILRSEIHTEPRSLLGRAALRQAERLRPFLFRELANKGWRRNLAHWVLRNMVDEPVTKVADIYPEMDENPTELSQAEVEAFFEKLIPTFAGFSFDSKGYERVARFHVQGIPFYIVQNPETGLMYDEARPGDEFFNLIYSDKWYLKSPLPNLFGYKDDANYSYDERLNKARRDKVEVIQPLFMSGRDQYFNNLPFDHFADIGSGRSAAALGEAFQEAGMKHFTAVEPYMLDSELKSELKAAGIEAATLDALIADGRRFNGVSSHMALEHVLDLETSLEKLAAITEDHGMLFLKVPKTPGKKPSDNHILEHLYYFNETSLRYYLEKAGFENIQMKNPPVNGLPDGALQAVASRRVRSESRQLWSGEPLLRDLEKEGYVQAGTVGPHRFPVYQKGDHRVLIKTRRGHWAPAFLERLTYEVAARAGIETSPVWLVRRPSGKIRAAIEYWEGSEQLAVVDWYGKTPHLSELAENNPNLIQVGSVDLRYQDWLPHLARPEQFVGSDILRFFMLNADSMEPKNILVKKVTSSSKGPSLYEARFIDYDFTMIFWFLHPSALAAFLNKQKNILAQYGLPYLEKLAAIKDKELQGLISNVFPEALREVEKETEEGIWQKYDDVKMALLQVMKLNRDIVRQALPEIQKADRAETRQRMTQVTFGGEEYAIEEVPEGSDFEVLVTNIERFPDLSIELGTNLERFHKIYGFISALHSAVKRDGGQNFLLPPASEREKELLSQAFRQVDQFERTAFHELMQVLPEWETRIINRLALNFLSRQEHDLLHSVEFDGEGGFVTTRPEQKHTMGILHHLSLWTLRLLKDRDFLQKFIRVIDATKSRWETSIVRDRIIPENIISLFASYHFGYGPGTVVQVEDEILNAVGLFQTDGLPVGRVSSTETAGRWLKELRWALPHLKDQPFYFLDTLEPRGIPQSLDETAHLLESEGEERAYHGIGEGGAIVSGVAETPFMIVSDSVKQNEVDEFEAWVKTHLPGYENLKIYRFPRGFITVGINENIHLIDHGHIDTVLGFIPREFTNHDQNILLMDPFYRAEIQQNATFQKFLEEQKIRKIVEVHPIETRFNPANFFQYLDKKLYFNYAPITIEALKLKKGMFRAIEREEDALKVLATAGGCLACLIALQAMQRSRGSRPGEASRRSESRSPDTPNFALTFPWNDWPKYLPEVREILDRLDEGPDIKELFDQLDESPSKKLFHLKRPHQGGTLEYIGKLHTRLKLVKSHDGLHFVMQEDSSPPFMVEVINNPVAQSPGILKIDVRRSSESAAGVQENIRVGYLMGNLQNDDPYLLDEVFHHLNPVFGREKILGNLRKLLGHYLPKEVTVIEENILDLSTLRNLATIAAGLIPYWFFGMDGINLIPAGDATTLRRVLLYFFLDSRDRKYWKKLWGDRIIRAHSFIPYLDQYLDQQREDVGRDFVTRDIFTPDVLKQTLMGHLMGVAGFSALSLTSRFPIFKEQITDNERQVYLFLAGVFPYGVILRGQRRSPTIHATNAPEGGRSEARSSEAPDSPFMDWRESFQHIRELLDQLDKDPAQELFRVKQPHQGGTLEYIGKLHVGSRLVVKEEPSPRFVVEKIGNFLAKSPGIVKVDIQRSWQILPGVTKSSWVGYLMGNLQTDSPFLLNEVFYGLDPVFREEKIMKNLRVILGQYLPEKVTALEEDVLDLPTLYALSRKASEEISYWFFAFDVLNLIRTEDATNLRLALSYLLLNDADRQKWRKLWGANLIRAPSFMPVLDQHNRDFATRHIFTPDVLKQTLMGHLAEVTGFTELSLHSGLPDTLVLQARKTVPFVNVADTTGKNRSEQRGRLVEAFIDISPFSARGESILADSLDRYLRETREELEREEIFQKHPRLLELYLARVEFAFKNLELTEKFEKTKKGGTFGRTPVRVLKKLVDWFPLRPGQHLLDLGVGDGLSTFILAELYGPRVQITGIEIDPDRYRFAEAFREFLRVEKKMEYKNVTLSDSDFLKLPIQQYDLIYFYFTEPEIYRSRFGHMIVDKLVDQLHPRASFVSSRFYLGLEGKNVRMGPERRREYFAKRPSLEYSEIDSSEWDWYHDAIVLTKRAEARSQIIVPPPLPNLDLESIPTESWQLSGFLYRLFNHKYAMRHLFQGSSDDIVLPPWFVFFKSDDHMKAVQRSSVNDYDPRFIDFRDIRNFPEVADQIVGGEIPLLLVYKPNTLSVGAGIFFIEEGQVPGEISITMALDKKTRLYESIKNDMEHLGAKTDLGDEERDIVTFVLPSEMPKEKQSRALQKMWRALPDHLNINDFGSMETMMPVVRDEEGRVIQTRIDFNGNLRTGEVVINWNRSQGQVGSSGYFANITDRNKALIDVKRGRYWLFHHLYGVYPYLSHQRQKGQTFKPYLENQIRQKFKYLTERLETAGLRLHGQITGSFDLLWLEPIEAQGFPRPFLGEFNVDPPEGHWSASLSLRNEQRTAPPSLNSDLFSNDFIQAIMNQRRDAWGVPANGHSKFNPQAVPPTNQGARYENREAAFDVTPIVFESKGLTMKDVEKASEFEVLYDEVISADRFLQDFTLSVFSKTDNLVGSLKPVVLSLDLPRYFPNLLEMVSFISQLVINAKQHSDLKTGAEEIRIRASRVVIPDEERELLKFSIFQLSTKIRKGWMNLVKTHANFMVKGSEGAKNLFDKEERKAEKLAGGGNALHQLGAMMIRGAPVLAKYSITETKPHSLTTDIYIELPRNEARQSESDIDTFISDEKDLNALSFKSRRYRVQDLRDKQVTVLFDEEVDAEDLMKSFDEGHQNIYQRIISALHLPEALRQEGYRDTLILIREFINLAHESAGRDVSVRVRVQLVEGLDSSSLQRKVIRFSLRQPFSTEAYWNELREIYLDFRKGGVTFLLGLDFQEEVWDDKWFSRGVFQSLQEMLKKRIPISLRFSRRLKGDHPMSSELAVALPYENPPRVTSPDSIRAESYVELRSPSGTTSSPGDVLAHKARVPADQGTSSEDSGARNETRKADDLHIKVRRMMRELNQKSTVFVDMADVAQFTDEQLEEFEMMAHLYKDLKFVFYNKGALVAGEKRDRIERLQEELGVEKIAIKDGQTASVFRRFGGRGRAIHISKGEIEAELLKWVPRKKDFHFFRYLNEETGLLPMALLYTLKGRRHLKGEVMDLSMVNQQILAEIREYMNNLVFARAA